MARAQKSQNSPAQGAARLTDAPRDAESVEPNSQYSEHAGNLGYGSNGDFSSIHDDGVTMHTMHEGDEDAPMHPGWDIDFSRTNLKAPEPRAGMEQRWIRCEWRSGQDLKNLNKQRRMGWTPRNPSTIPQHQRFYPTMKHSSAGDCIYVDGMMLCERPKQIGDKARAHIRAQVQRQKAAVSHAIQSQNSRNMRRGLPPILMEERRDIGGGGKTPKLQDD